MYLLNKNDWFGNVRGDILSGLVVALALIPEAIAFSNIAGVDPRVGLYASFSIAVITALTGGRPGMISAATGAMALLMVTLVKEHGLDYLFAATILAGGLQVLAGFFKLANLMRFVSRSVVTGFVNALAILIFLAQMPELTTHGNIHVYWLVALGLAIIYGFPYLNKTLPSPLVCIVVLTVIVLTFGLNVHSVGDTGKLPSGQLPSFLLPSVPFNFETLGIIFPYSFSLAVVGLLESMMTATIVDDLTDTDSRKNLECKSQGLANIVTGFFGGMAGCAMIGQSVINVKSGGRGRLSCLIAGVVLLLMVVYLSDWIAKIPMAALVAVMIMVSIGTFSWQSIVNIRSHPIPTTAVMLVTTLVVVFTHNLAYGVFAGVLVAAMSFANKVGRYMAIQSERTGDVRNYKVTGQVFFASSEDFIAKFDFKEVLDIVNIDVTHAHFWDITAVGALDKVVLKFRREGATVNIIGLNEASSTIVDKYGIYDKPDLLDRMDAH